MNFVVVGFSVNDKMIGRMFVEAFDRGVIVQVRVMDGFITIGE